MKTTLNKIRAHGPCSNGWYKLLRHLNKTRADDEPLSLVTILDLNGIGDAIWCLRAVDGYDREMRLFAVACARDVQHLMKDQRSINAIDTAELFAIGEATEWELGAAWSVAEYAATEAEDALDFSADAAWCATYAADRSASAAARYAANAALDSADSEENENVIRAKQEQRFREMVAKAEGQS